MADTTLPAVRRFLRARSIAIVGVSRDPKHFSRMLFRDLRKRGLPVVPVNPRASEIEGIPAAKSVPEGTEAVLVMTPAAATLAVCEDAIAAGAEKLWMYRAIGHGAVDHSAAERCREAGMEVVEGHCPYMFLEDTAWIHRLHGGLMKLTGKYPQQSQTEN
ncbi:MAG: CoA-binding protein [Bryobacterales bacterium]|nr:CoA-binding protein [Bryobacterales bacterium]